jgi:hypothetical protein
MMFMCLFGGGGKRGLTTSLAMNAIAQGHVVRLSYHKTIQTIVLW